MWTTSIELHKFYQVLVILSLVLTSSHQESLPLQKWSNEPHVDALLHHYSKMPLVNVRYETATFRIFMSVCTLKYNWNYAQTCNLVWCTEAWELRTCAREKHYTLHAFLTKGRVKWLYRLHKVFMMSSKNQDENSHVTVNYTIHLVDYLHK